MECHTITARKVQVFKEQVERLKEKTWNHQFFWESMKPNGGGELSGKLLELIKRDFGSYDTFVNEFKAAAAIQFGSCWAWLICKNFFTFYLHRTMCLINPFVIIKAKWLKSHLLVTS